MRMRVCRLRMRIIKTRTERGRLGTEATPSLVPRPICGPGYEANSPHNAQQRPSTMTFKMQPALSRCVQGICQDVKLLFMLCGKSLKLQTQMQSSSLMHSNQQAALRNIHQLCPALSKVLTNTYREDVQLFIDGEVLLSQEGTT